ncbi:hypothetical protein FQN50_009265 [Emmonsiellopsis sp. PD_5]|nr:hypothetical protein FQN50_009265 [Emmonsiellopsis sp. PD_5]
MPHPLTLFSLVPFPENERSAHIVNHPDNAHLVSTSSDNKTLAIEVGLHIRGQSSPTLAMLGRDTNVDIVLDDSSISRNQCSFEIDLKTGVVMLYDRSFRCTCKVSGDYYTPFESGRERCVVVSPVVNTQLEMGGENRNLVQFTLDWYHDPLEILKSIKAYNTIPFTPVQNPRHARTIDDAETVGPSRRITRIHTGQCSLRMRSVILGRLGSGQFGTVYKAVDVDSGRLMAVKILTQPENTADPQKIFEWERSFRYALKREVEALSNLSHPRIVEYITSQGWDQGKVEIYMALQEGSLRGLIESGISGVEVVKSVASNILEALDFIASKGVIHRDVKPDNILYMSEPAGIYNFLLGDFGVCNREGSAATETGTNQYMAPEMFYPGGRQTTKVDIWSLFITLMWVLNDQSFREKVNYLSSGEAQALAKSAASGQYLSDLKEMVAFDPAKRASAAQMLVKIFKGEGLTTRRSQILPLDSDGTPTPRESPAPEPQPDGTSDSDTLSIFFQGSRFTSSQFFAWVPIAEKLCWARRNTREF